MFSEKKKNWIRKLRPIEKFYTRGHEFELLQTCYHLNISSREQLKEEDVRRALEHLKR